MKILLQRNMDDILATHYTYHIVTLYDIIQDQGGYISLYQRFPEYQSLYYFHKLLCLQKRSLFKVLVFTLVLSIYTT